MTNFDTARNALETSLNSSGSALREHEKASQSLEFKLNSLKATWQSLSQSFMGSDFLKSVLDGVINLVNGLDKLIDTFGTLPTLLGVVAGGFSAFKNKGLFTFDKDAKSIQLLGTQLNSLKGNFTQVKTAIDRYNSMSSKSASFQEKYNKVMAGSSTSIGKYLQGLNGAKASFGGYIASLVGATAKTIVLEAATIAMNAALTMGISFLISAGISAIQKWINAKEELAEKVDEVTSKFKEQHTELVKNKSSFESQATRYAQLAKGVNDLGENVSLTADEYAEYQDIVNSIADQVPSLIQGYDSQGNAILNYAGNVKTLTDAYEELIKKQNDSVLKGDAYKDIEKDFKNAMEDAKSTDGGFAKIKASLNEINALEALLRSNNVDELIPKISEKYGANFSYLINELENAGVDKMKVGESAYDFVERAVTQNRDIVQRVVNDFNANLDAEAEGMRSAAQAALSNAFDFSDSEYKNINDKTQALVRQVVGNFDAEQFDKIVKSGKTVEEYINDMLDSFKNMSSGEATELEAAFDLQTKFNGGEISYGEYIQGVQNAEKLIDGLNIDDEVKNQIKLTLDTEEIQNEYDALKNRLTSEEYGIKMKTEEAEEFLDGLTSSEYQIAIDLIDDEDVDFNNFDSIKELRAYIEKQAKINDALNYTIAIDVETENIEALNTAMAESVSGAGLSSEAIAALKSRYAELEGEGYNLSAMFEETANGIHLNREAVGELEQKLASNKLAETDKQLEVLKGRYDELTTEIDNCTDASERAALYTEQQSIVDKINDLATLASQYKGLTSAYNAWMAAEEAGSERDMYESIIEGFENIGDEISRGWYDDGTIKFLELITGQTGLAGKSATELKEIWNSLDDTIKGTSYSVRDFFTVNEDGDPTSTGAYNFLKAVEELGDNGTIKALKGENIDKLVERNKDGKIVAFDFSVVGGDEAVADALGISEEMVQIIQRTLDDAGFVVTLDGKYTLLADLKTYAEEANAKLKELGKTDIDFNFDTTNFEELNEQLGKSKEILDKFRNKDGTINMKMEGAKEALDIASYFTAMTDSLSEPIYMELETNQVEESLREPLEKMQEFEDLVKKKHQFELTGDTEGLEETEQKMNEIVDYIYDNDDLKAKLEIEGLSKEEIKSKLEKGEIEIPATVDIQLEMSDDIKDMRLMMMNQLGLVDDNEVKLKIGYDIDESTVDDLTPEEQEVVVKFITENEDEFNNLTDEEKEVVIDIATDDSALKALEEHGIEIEAFAKIFGVEEVDDLKKKLDGLTDTQILVLTEVLGRTDVEKLKTAVAGLDDKTIKAIAEALGKGDVEGLKTTIKGLDNKTVQAIAQAFGYKDVNDLNNAIDNLDPKTVQAIAQALGITDVDSLRNAINRLSNKDVDVAANVDGKDDVNGLKGAIDTLKGKTVTVWAQIKKKASSLWDKLTGGGVVDGTAHIDGTAFVDGTIKKNPTKNSGKAFKQGNWGTKDSGIALGGEEAPELLVRNGRWHLIGEKGAEFFGYRKGDIIFNASQTKEIFEKGKITHGNGRGKALVSGTAFSKGSGGGEEPEVTSIVVGTNKNTGKSYTKSTDSKDDFEEIFDLIEIAIKRIEREIDNLDQKANRTYKSWSSRNSALASEISKVGSEISLQQKAYQEYLKAANGVGLSSAWKKKVQKGEVDIETVKDEVLAEKIKDYQNYYEAALECKDAIEDLKDTEAELFRQRFDHIQAQYDGILQGYEHTETMLNEYIAQAEAQGHLVSKKYYQALIKNEKQNISQLKKEQSALIKARDEAVASGKIAKNSEEWISMCNEIDGVTQSIEESTTALLEFDNAMREIDWSVFDLIQERISDITAESEFLIELMSNDKLFDDKGKLTEQGVATVGLHALNYNTAMYQADDYGKEIAKLDKQIAKDPYDQELINRRRELVEAQREQILAAEDYKNSIKSLLEDAYSQELDYLQEKIDKTNEAIDSQKD